MDFANMIVTNFAGKTVESKIRKLIELGIDGRLGDIIENIETRKNSENIYSIKEKITFPLYDYVFELESISSLVHFSKIVLGENMIVGIEIAKAKQDASQKFDGIVALVGIEIATLEKIVSSTNITERVKKILLEDYFPEAKQCLECVIKFVKEYFDGAV